MADADESGEVTGDGAGFHSPDEELEELEEVEELDELDELDELEVPVGVDFRSVYARASCARAQTFASISWSHEVSRMHSLSVRENAGFTELVVVVPQPVDLS